MKHTLILLLFSCAAWGQTKSDTLFIGNKKVLLLKRPKLFYSRNDGPVMLPSEYISIWNYDSKLGVKYQQLSDSSEIQEMDEDENRIVITIKKYRYDTVKAGSHKLYSFVDTVFIDAKSFTEFKPFIKVNGKKIYFCAASIYTLKDGILYEYLNRMALDGRLLNIWDNWQPWEPINLKEIENIKATTYILEDLFYIKNKATYYLDRQFIIIAK
jgi:hypothetical protein